MILGLQSVQQYKLLSFTGSWANLGPNIAAIFSTDLTVAKSTPHSTQAKSLSCARILSLNQAGCNLMTSLSIVKQSLSGQETSQ